MGSRNRIPCSTRVVVSSKWCPYGPLVAASRVQKTTVHELERDHNNLIRSPVLASDWFYSSPILWELTPYSTLASSSPSNAPRGTSIVQFLTKIS